MAIQQSSRFMQQLIGCSHSFCSRRHQPLCLRQSVQLVRMFLGEALLPPK
jgi:hypothetical protein